MANSTNSVPTLESIREALAVANLPLTASAERQAAVALVLAGEEDNLSVCFILRAEHDGDPWSGHMALPGGKVDPTDKDTRAGAERETWEEIGLKLKTADRIAPFGQVSVFGRGLNYGMILYPFAYYIGKEMPDFTLNKEVAEAYWIPFATLLDPAKKDTVSWEGDTRNEKYPALKIVKKPIWGLTYRVIEQFFDLLGQPLNT